MIVVAVLATMLVVVSGRPGSSDEDTAASPSSASDQASAGDPAPGSSASGAPTSDNQAIQIAMQKYVDALNSRDLTRIQGAVCSEAKAAEHSPIDNGATMVLEGLVDLTIDGDTAKSGVVAHMERSGGERSKPEALKASFRKESSTWLYCPGAKADIGI